MTVPVTAETMEGQPCTLADMEASGMYQSAQLFFEQHRMLFFKVVYDQPDEDMRRSMDDPKALVQSVIMPWVKRLCEALKMLYDTWHPAAAACGGVFLEEEQAAYEMLAGRLHSTASMRSQLWQLLYYKKLVGSDIVQWIDRFCEENDIGMCHSKKEGMKWLERLRESL